MNPLQINQNTRKRFLEGWKNQVIRVCIFYLFEGLDVMNKFRYLILTILGVSAILKFTNYFVIAGIFVSSLPVLAFVGYVWIRRVKKSLEVMGIDEATHYGKYSIEVQEKQIELLEKILEKTK